MQLSVRFAGRVNEPAARVDPGLWGEPGSGDPVAPELINHSPSAGMYAIAKRVPAGEPPASPAASQSDDGGGGVGGRGPTPRGLGQSLGPDPVGDRGSVDIASSSN